MQRPITLQAADPVTIGTDATLPEHSAPPSWGERARSWLPWSLPAVGKPENADGSEYTQRNDQESSPTASSGWSPWSQSLGGGSGAASSARPNSGIQCVIRPRRTTKNTSERAPVRATPIATYNSMSPGPASCRQHAGCPCSFQSTMHSASAGARWGGPRPHFHVVPGPQYSSAHQAGHSNATHYDPVPVNRRSKWTHLRSTMGHAISDVPSTDIMGGTLITWNNRGQPQQLEFARQRDGTVSRTVTDWGSNGSVAISSVTIAK